MTDISVQTIRTAVIAHYQPIVDLADERIVGCEALARWRTADGTLTNLEFCIDAVEADEELATALTARMFECIARDLADLLDAHPQFYVSVNIPPITLGRKRLGEVLQRLDLLRRIGQIVGEITERHSLDALGRAAIREAREVGARIAIDDFGTGNSGLQHLIGLEVDILKIDRSFVVCLGRDRIAERLVRGIAALAAALRVGMVAEGVETPEQALFLRAVGVEKGQGWLWSKALDAATLKATLP